MRGAHLQLGAQRGDRAAQFVRGVGDEAPLAVHGGLQRGERLVGRTGQPCDLVARAGLRHPPAQVLGRGDRGHLAPDALDRAQRPPRHQPGHPGDDEEHDRQPGQHRAAHTGDGPLLGGERGARVDGQGDSRLVRGLDGGEPVVGAVAVDRGGAVGEVRVLGGDLAAGGAGAVRPVVVIAVVVRAPARRVRKGGDPVRAGAGDRLQVLGDGHHPAVLVGHLDGMVLLVARPQLVVRHVQGQLPGDLPGRHLGLEARLAGEVGAQDEQDGEPGGGEREGHDHGGTERRPGPYGSHSASSR